LTGKAPYKFESGLLQRRVACEPEIFEATGSRGGFMLGHSQCGPRDQLQSIVDLLVPELQRRGRFRTAYTGRTLRENLAG
jgi:hypothetical protein